MAKSQTKRIGHFRIGHFNLVDDEPTATNLDASADTTARFEGCVFYTPIGVLAADGSRRESTEPLWWPQTVI